MNYLKLQTALMKAANDRDDWRHKRFEYTWGITENNDIAVFTRYNAVIVPKKEWYLDTSKIFKDMKPMSLAGRMIKDGGEAREIEFTCFWKQMKKTKAVQFKIGDKEIWVDEALLKPFDLTECTFRGNSPVSPVYIYNGSDLLGMVLPMIKENQ